LEGFIDENGTDITPDDFEMGLGDESLPGEIEPKDF